MIEIVYIKSALSFEYCYFFWHGTFTLGIIVVCVDSLPHRHRYHTVFLPSDVFRLILSQMRKNKKKQKIETVNSCIKNLLSDTCESRDKVYISF